MKFIGKKYCKGEEMTRIMLASLMLILLVSCMNRTSVNSPEGQVGEDAQFHADNDIAMMVCSLVDAVRVGERLDSADYFFEGVLTDGQGTPLYTDIDGNPGEWRARVVSGDEARISNLFIGDLMTADLRNYILNALGLNDADLATAYVNPNNESELIWLYDLGDADVSFSEIETKTPSDLEGIIMTITVFRKA